MQYYLTSATLRDCTTELFRDLGFTEILCLAASLVKVCVSLLTAAKSKSILLGSTNYKNNFSTVTTDFRYTAQHSEENKCIII